MSPARTAFTLVALHAHPDDEALFTGGTLARAAAEGHRVVLVVATDGEAGLAGVDRSGPGPTPGLGLRRTRELQRAADALGVARVVRLGHADSGWSPSGTYRATAGVVPFSRLDPEDVAAEVAAVLEEEAADVLTTYDAAGGYGHPDHVQVHRAGALAARLAGTPVVLEATVDRRALARGVGLLRRLGRVLPVPELPDLDGTFTEPGAITHRVDVRAHVRHKRRALAAHASQAGGTARTVSVLSHLPAGVDRLVLGHEWFREPGRIPAGPPLDDVFASLRGPVSGRPAALR